MSVCYVLTLLMFNVVAAASVPEWYRARKYHNNNIDKILFKKAGIGQYNIVVVVCRARVFERVL